MRERLRVLTGLAVGMLAMVPARAATGLGSQAYVSGGVASACAGVGFAVVGVGPSVPSCAPYRVTAGDHLDVALTDAAGTVGANYAVYDGDFAQPHRLADGAFCGTTTVTIPSAGRLLVIWPSSALSAPAGCQFATVGVIDVSRA